MRIEDKRLSKAVIKCMAILVLAIAACRFSRGYFVVIMAMLGVWWAFTQNIGRALSCFAFFPLLIVLDQGIFQQTAISGVVLRISPLLIGMVLFIQASSRRGANKLPFGGLFIYLFLAIISSMNGWCPAISYMKMVNFVVFLIGIWLGTQNMQDRPQDIYRVRTFFLALPCLIVFGSLATIPFPAISYSTNFMWTGVQSQAEATAAMAELSATGGLSLFSGILNHSQALAPVLSCCIALTLSDMLFIVRRGTILHIAILICAMLELYLTRSRTGLFSCSIGLFMVVIYAAKRLSVDYSTRMKIKKMVGVGALILAFVVIFSEISNRTITRWIYKSNDAHATQDVGVGDALTGTRQRLIDESVAEFKMNPLFGMGFQVNWGTAELFGGKGFVFSAPIEKGLLPVMILGEGGIVGVIAFAIFLISFYSTCARKKCWITIVMFTTFLATNIGEATFFSPGGIGGILWMICVVGGFSLDTFIRSRNLIAYRVY